MRLAEKVAVIGFVLVAYQASAPAAVESASGTHQYLYGTAGFHWLMVRPLSEPGVNYDDVVGLLPGVGVESHGDNSKWGWFAEVSTRADLTCLAIGWTYLNPDFSFADLPGPTRDTIRRVTTHGTDVNKIGDWYIQGFRLGLVVNGLDVSGTDLWSGETRFSGTTLNLLVTQSIFSLRSKRVYATLFKWDIIVGQDGGLHVGTQWGYRFH